MGPGFAGAHCFSQDFRLEVILKMSCEIAILSLIHISEPTRPY